MKKRLLNAALLLLASASLNAQNISQEKLVITGTKFTYPLLERWAKEFEALHPEVDVKVVSKLQPNETADLKVIAYERKKEEIPQTEKSVVLGKYAILPVANSNNPALKTLSDKGLKEKEFIELFFEDENEQFEEKKKKQKYEVNLYTRESRSCAPIAFASHFGFDQSAIKGKGISGEDKYLIHAVKKDSAGVTYNNLGFIYDLTTRKPVEGISVIPLDLNGNGKLDAEEKIFDDLDKVIEKLESDKIASIPVENINVVYNVDNTNKNIKLFLSWVLEQGQKYNHDYGFLTFDSETLSKQKQILTLNK
jgi:phosphate transport system substrate-binding protein